MGATIKDIAKKVGVSPSTVSRVINGSAPISEEIKDKIHTAMKELNYHPNSQARMLVTGSTCTIALAIDAADESTFSNTFFDRSVYAIERVAQRNGYGLLITNDFGKLGSSIKDLVYAQRIDGIVIPASSVTKSLATLLDKEKMPWVILGEPRSNDKNYYWVDIDNAGGSSQAVRHLIQQGYKKIAYVAGNCNTVFSRKRIEGFIEETKKAGCYTKNIISCDKDYSEVENIVRQQFRQGTVDAFICSNNILAYHVLKALKTLNISAPKVGVVTFDNCPFAEYMDPPLTTVDVDTYRLGEQAARLLIGRIKGKELDKKEVLIETNLIVRESTRRI